MMAVLLTTAFTVWTILLAVFGEREKTRDRAKKFDLLTGLCGIAAAVAGFVISLVLIQNVPSEVGTEWVAESFRVCVTVSVTAFVLLFMICAVTSFVSFANPKLRGGFSHKIRIIMIAVSGVFVLTLSFLGYIASNDHVPLDKTIIIFDAGLGLMMRFCSLIENKGRKNEKKDNN